MNKDHDALARRIAKALTIPEHLLRSRSTSNYAAAVTADAPGPNPDNRTPERHDRLGHRLCAATNALGTLCRRPAINADTWGHLPRADYQRCAVHQPPDVYNKEPKS